MSVCRSLVTSTTTSPRCLRLNLRVEMAKTQLARDLESVFKDLDGITTTKDQSSDTIRALIRDLHRSPVGHKASPKPCRSSPPPSQGFPHPRRHRCGRGNATAAGSGSSSTTSRGGPR
jgi:hypothetical protein